MKTIFLFDIDGVLIRPSRYYSRILFDQGYTLAPEKLDEFYRSDALCTTGKEDPLVKIRPYLDSFGWQFDTEEYFNQQLEYEKGYLDHELIGLVGGLRSHGYKCYLATDQNHHRKSLLLDRLGFRAVFDGWFVSADIGHRKLEKEFWEITLMSFPEKACIEILYIDDRMSNLDQALSHGITGFHISGEEKIGELKNNLQERIGKRGR